MVEKNQIVNVTITDLGTEGEGIGKLEGFPLFIKDALPGDEIEAKVIKVKKNYGYGRLERVVKPSPFRVEAACKFARQCGGCQIQTLAYSKQLEFKQNKVRNNLIHIGGVEENYLNQIMEPILGMDVAAEEENLCVPLYYRNKAQVPFGKNKDGKTICGFYAGRTHSIIDNTNCLLGAKENQEVLEKVLSYMKENQVAPYEEETGKGLIRHVLIRKARATGQVMVCVIINGKHLPKKQALIEKLVEIPGMTSISISVNEKRNNVILGDSYETIWGKDTIEDAICPWEKIENEDQGETWKRCEENGIHFQISPLSFYQVNPVQTERLYSTALSYAELTGKETVWDLYCGIGTISLFLAGKAKHVCGVEIVPQAIADAWKNAELNGIQNASFYVGKAEEVLPAFYQGKDMSSYELEERKEQGMSANAIDPSALLHPDVVCVDPPRKGCDEACLETMVQMQPERIVYVSCDSATLARDVKYLQEHGYELRKVRACDMFPNSVHTETVCLLSRKP